MTDLVNSSQPESQAVPQRPPLYSEGSIGGATFLGGPLAGGLLLRRNFLNIGQPSSARLALVVSAVATVAIFGAIFALPETVTDAIPNQVIPFCYTAIIVGLARTYQGRQLREYKSSGGPFYSGWRAAGVGLANLLLMLGVVFTSIMLFMPQVDADRYNADLAKIQANETKALSLYDMDFDGESGRQAAVEFIDKTGLPAWKDSLVILDEMDKVALDEGELLKQNETLRNYVNLRIKMYGLLRKSLAENTDAYEKEIEALSDEINALKM